MPLVGIVAFSFALRGKTPEEMRRLEPNPCNKRLAREVRRLALKYPDHVIVSQWEVTKQLKKYGVVVNHSVELHGDGSYLDSQDVWKVAAPLFASTGAWDVVAVAQPFLQLWRVRSFVQKSGFRVMQDRIRRIGFDNDPLNSQWWTKSAPALFVYALLQVGGRAGGHGGSQTA